MRINAVQSMAFVTYIYLFLLQYALCGHPYTVIGDGLLEGYKISCQQFCEFQVYNLALGCFEKI